VSKVKFKWLRPDPFVLHVKVDAQAIDSYKHVNNSVYLRWIDDCARAHSASVGIDPDQAIEFGYGMAVRESRATYLAAAFEGDELQIGVWITQSDHKLRVTREFQIIRASDGLTLVKAEVDYVCINIQTGRASRMPDKFKQLYIPCFS